jgi:hypothetical protein
MTRQQHLRQTWAICILAVALAWIGCRAAMGQTVLDASQLAPGRHYYAVDVAPDGSLTFRPLAVVVLTADPTPPGPDPGPGPQPPDPDPDIEPDRFGDLGRNSFQWFSELATPGLKAAGTDLGAIYTEAADGLADLSIGSVGQAAEGIKSAIAQLELSDADRDAWALIGWRVSVLWDDHQADESRDSVIEFWRILGASIKLAGESAGAKT